MSCASSAYSGSKESKPSPLPWVALPIRPTKEDAPMKMSILALLLTALAAASIGTAHAFPMCGWPRDPQFRQTKTELPPSLIDLDNVPIGQPMATVILFVYQDNLGQGLGTSWPYCSSLVDYVYWRFTPTNASLAPGYSDVYTTNVPGLGVRYFLHPYRMTSGEYGNYRGAHVPIPPTIDIELIRTGQKVATGDNIYLTYPSLGLYVNDEYILEIRTPLTSQLASRGSFSSCVGSKFLSIPLGRVTADRLGQQEASRDFDIDVLCTGVPAGSQLPVKVYFDGNSDGPGRLNLTPGGAKGVEIALTTDWGLKLPFAKASALNMSWIRTEATGERYRLPVKAQYVRKGADPVTPGMANAVLNYILEYD